MRMLQTILWHQGRRLHPERHQVFPEIQDPLRRARNPLLPTGIPIPTPAQLRQRRCSGPHLPADHRVVALFAPQGGRDADDELGFGGREVGREVVVVDALPGLVGRAPAASIAAVVEIRQAVDSVRVGLHVVAGIVGDPAAEAAVEVEPVRGGDDDLVAGGGERLDVREAVVPGLHCDVLGDGEGVRGGDGHVFPHYQLAVWVRAVVEDRHCVVYPILQQIVVGSRGVGCEPLGGDGREIVAASLQLVAADVEEVVGEDGGELTVDFLHGGVGFGVQDFELAWVGLDGGVIGPVVVGPPGVGAGYDGWVDLLPT